MEDQPLLYERIELAVRRVFFIEDTTYGDERKGFVVNTMVASFYRIQRKPMTGWQKRLIHWV